ncbi:hypothetical protein FVEN_g5524 [Fusarium venenatum]|nr:hypothetical protein FVEN_g5524 [Fusarium venenatum]
MHSSRDAKEFATYIVNKITDKQAKTQGQPDTDPIKQQGVIISHLQSITPALKTDLYILLNKNKKQNDGGAELKSKGKVKRGKAKGKGKGKAKNTREDDEEGMDEENHEDGHDHQLTAAGGAMSSRQQSEAHSHGSGGSRHSSHIAQNREISASSALDASQHSQHSNTTIQRRRSKQQTRFADDIEDSDLE